MEEFEILPTLHPNSFKMINTDLQNELLKINCRLNYLIYKSGFKK